MNKAFEAKVEECRQFCMGLSDDKEFKEQMSTATFEEMVMFLLDNGFEFEVTEP